MYMYYIIRRPLHTCTLEPCKTRANGSLRVTPNKALDGCPPRRLYDSISAVQSSGVNANYV